ncbi:MAG: N-acetylmuramoyl-L-alanine amidase [bacterium]
MRLCIASLLVIISLLIVHADILMIGVQKQDLPAPFLMDNGEVVAPAAVALPTLGAQLTVVKNDFTLTTGMGNVIKMQVGSRAVTVDGKKLNLPAAPQLIDDKPWLPLTSLTPWLGVNSRYDAKARILTLTPWLKVAVEARKGGVVIFTRSVVAISYVADTIKDNSNTMRAIFDFAGTAQRGDAAIDVGQAQLAKVRQSQHSDVNTPYTRLVLDLMDQKVAITPTTGDDGRLLMIAVGAPENLIPPAGFLPGSEKPSGDVIIYLDAGHGGKDSGAIGPNGVKEKDINLDIVSRTDVLLRAAGFTTMLTRNDNSAVALYDRPAKANAGKATLFISVHCNAYSVQSADGSEVYYYTAQSKTLAKAIHDAVQEKLGRDDRGINHEHDFVVIRESKMPSVLLETAFISNPTEEALLNTEAFRQRAAEGLFNGIKRYLGK